MKNAETNAPLKRRNTKNCASSRQVVRSPGLGETQGLRVIIVFEGRDAAGKRRHHPRPDRTAQPAHVPRRCVTCPRRIARNRRCIQRYMQHFPAAGRS